jgi:hypothetical protein
MITYFVIENEEVGKVAVLTEETETYQADGLLTDPEQELFGRQLKDIPVGIYDEQGEIIGT